MSFHENKEVYAKFSQEDRLCHLRIHHILWKQCVFTLGFFLMFTKYVTIQCITIDIFWMDVWLDNSATSTSDID